MEGKERIKWRPLNSEKEDWEGNTPLEKGVQQPCLSQSHLLQALYPSLSESTSQDGDQDTATRIGDSLPPEKGCPWRLRPQKRLQKMLCCPWLPAPGLSLRSGFLRASEISPRAHSASSPTPSGVAKKRPGVLTQCASAVGRWTPAL